MVSMDVAEMIVVASTLAFVGFWLVDSALDNFRWDSNVLDFDD